MRIPSHSRAARDVRAALATDLPRLLQLEAMFPGDRLSRRQFRHHLGSSRARLRVAECGDELVGYALTFLRQGSRIARLYSIAVNPAFRGHGIGARLLEDAMAQARHAGCERLRLEVREDNAPAMTLYRRRGFIEFGRIPGYYEDGCTAVRFECALTPRD